MKEKTKILTSALLLKALKDRNMSSLQSFECREIIDVYFKTIAWGNLSEAQRCLFDAFTWIAFSVINDSYHTGKKFDCRRAHSIKLFQMMHLIYICSKFTYKQLKIFVARTNSNTMNCHLSSIKFKDDYPWQVGVLHELVDTGDMGYREIAESVKSKVAIKPNVTFHLHLTAAIEDYFEN